MKKMGDMPPRIENRLKHIERYEKMSQIIQEKEKNQCKLYF